MSKVASHPSRIWLDEFALASYLIAAGVKVSQELADVTTFGDTGPRKVVGNYEHSADFSGLFDAATGALDPVLAIDAWTDETHYLLQAFGAAAENDVAFMQPVRLTERPIEVKSGSAVLLNFSADGDGQIVRGKILRSADITGTGQGTGRNLGVSTAGQSFVVDYRVLAVSGAGSIVLACQESSDDGSGDPYAAVAGLGATFTAVGVQRFSTTAATEAWKRIAVTTFTTFTSVTVLVSAGIAPNS